MVNLQPLESFLEKRKRIKEENGLEFPDDTDIAIGGVRNLESAMLVFDVAKSSDYSDNDFVEYISPFLHTCFHIVNEKKGIVDKYTGDGALVSFCGKGITEDESCKYAIETALEISDLAHELTKNYNFPVINVRIGIDFGPIKVERIGVRGKTQLIVIGSPAVSAKRLEEIGKEISFNAHSTIFIGYDVRYNLSEKRKGFCSRYTPKGELKDFFDSASSFYNKTKPYPIYQYTGRYRKD